MCLIGERYREKRSGPPTDPCGTPKVSRVGSDVVSLTMTYCERPVICDLNHCSASPELQCESRDVDKFEKQNPSISVNVLGYDKEVYPLRITKNAKPDTVNLLLISEGENNHFCFYQSH